MKIQIVPPERFDSAAERQREQIEKYIKLLSDALHDSVGGDVDKVDGGSLVNALLISAEMTMSNTLEHNDKGDAELGPFAYGLVNAFRCHLREDLTMAGTLPLMIAVLQEMQLFMSKIGMYNSLVGDALAGVDYSATNPGRENAR